MYAGVSSAMNINSGVAQFENENIVDMPEWKKLLIMKKRAGCTPIADEAGRRNTDLPQANVNTVRNGENNVCDYFSPGCNKFSRSAKVVEQDFKEISVPKTVTIGNINVELRSVKATDNQDSLDACKSDRASNSDLGAIEYEDGCEDLQYGPGIVDKLRARFLNMSTKKQCKPVVRRFSSLENLPGSNAGPYRVNARGIRQNGFKVGSGSYYGSGNVKKAQSMETLICSSPEQQIFASSRRPNARYVVGVKARILAKNISPITMFTDENDEPNEKSPSPVSSPRLSKSVRRWDYNRSPSAPNINEDELPKPDTVKHVKKIFESSPVASGSSEKPSVRFRKIPGTTPTSVSVHNNGAILGVVRPPVKKLEDSPDAKTSAKESCDQKKLLSPASESEKWSEREVNKAGLDDSLSANGSCDTVDKVLSPSEVPHPLISSSEDLREEGNSRSDPAGASFKVTLEQLPLEDYKHSEALSQVSRVGEPNGAELVEEEDLSPSVVSPEEGMVVAAATSSDSFPKKGSAWQKAPPATTSVIFDFRGKDVKPNISLKPAPFGCRPAKVSRSSTSHKKRSSSPQRSCVNGMGATSENFEIEKSNQTNGNDEEDEEDWDDMDIGADLPAISGIVFTGENVKVGRGALLETRNKKLTIQFDDRATSTFEYPSENASPSPMEENGGCSNSFSSSDAISSPANSRLGLSNYTPQVLSSNEDFELGISQPSHRPSSSLPDKLEKNDDVPTLDVVIPADPEETGVWSATESADILF